MKKTFLLLLTVIMFLSGCIHSFFQEDVNVTPSRAMVVMGKEEVPANFVPRDIKVVTLGDSLTEGVGGPAKKGGYLPYLKERLEKKKGIQTADLLNFGVGGNRTTQLLDRLETKEIADAVKQADLIIITIGGNDMMKVVSENISSLEVEDFKQESKLYGEHLNQIMMKIRQLNQTSSIALLGLYNPFTNWFSDIEEINEVIDDWNTTSQTILSQYEDAYYVEVFELFERNIDELLYKDHFHPNDKGYQLIAEEIYSKLDEQVLDTLPLYTVNKEENEQ